MLENWQILEDGWKTPVWDETTIQVPRRLLQECMLAMSEVRGLIQRLESHGESCCTLDARDERALEWGHAVLANIRSIVKSNQ